MRIKTFGAATSAALAAAAMLAIPATANAANPNPNVHFNSGVSISVSRAADKSVSASLENTTASPLECFVVVMDKDSVKEFADLARKLDSNTPPTNSDDISFADAKIYGMGFDTDAPSGLIALDKKSKVDVAVSMMKDDKATKPEGVAICSDEKQENVYFAATVTGGLIDAIDFGGSLAGNTGSISSLDFGGSLGL